MRALALLGAVCLAALGAACGDEPAAAPTAAAAPTGTKAAVPAPDATPTQATGAPADEPEGALPPGESDADPQPTGEGAAAPEAEPLPDKPTPASVDAAPTPADAARLKRSGDLGRDVAEAMRARQPEAMLALTPYDGGPWAKACPPEHPAEGKREAKARIEHCLKVIPWDTASDIRVAGGRPTGDAAPGCAPQISGFESLTLLVVTPSGNFEAKLRGVAGHGDKAESYSGVISCGPRKG